MAKREEREPGRAGQRAVGTRWAGSAQELFVGLREWRALHPRASLAEIEAELDRRLSRVRAQMLADLALASRAAAVGRAGPAERPRCGACGGPLIREGRRCRTLQTVNDQARSTIRR